MTPPRIRIAYVVSTLNIGGSEKVAIENINCLDEKYFQISLICLTPETEIKDSILNIIPLNKRIEIFYPRYSFNSDYSLKGYFLLAFRSGKPSNENSDVITLLEKIRPQLLHFHTSPRELWIGKRYEKTHAAELVFTDHIARMKKDNKVSTVARLLLSVCYKKLLKKFNVISVSEVISNSMRKNKIYDNRKTNSVIKNGIAVEKFKPSEGSKNNTVIIYVSRISQVKQHATLIKAWSLLKDIPNKHLLIVGPDELNGSIQNLAKALSCDDSVTFTGGTSKVYDYLCQSDIAVFPSSLEGLPIALLEKMACALPVVVSDIPELASVIRDGETGLIFKEGDEKDLAEKLIFLINNYDRRKQIGIKAREVVLNEFNSSLACSKLKEFYQNII